MYTYRGVSNGHHRPRKRVVYKSGGHQTKEEKKKSSNNNNNNNNGGGDGVDKTDPPSAQRDGAVSTPEPAPSPLLRSTLPSRPASPGSPPPPSLLELRVVKLIPSHPSLFFYNCLNLFRAIRFYTTVTPERNSFCVNTTGMPIPTASQCVHEWLFREPICLVVSHAVIILTLLDEKMRSPWSNKYHPFLEDGNLPSPELRKLEIEANEVFAIYCDQYYEGGISSVYMWEDDNESFVGCFLIKKDGSKSGQGRRGYLQEGSWDAIHVIEVGPEEEGTSRYCLTSTVMLSLMTDAESSGTFSLSGSIRRQMNMDLSVADGHLCNMGRMIEEMESKLRNSLNQVYFGKTREMVCTLRPPAELVQLKLPDRDS
ncbi:hypothetical protein Syun_013714 [Stephania yunnanensis]|uniref:F-actin-capping protein subunit beta n=1 Tax=Stephania yunnanensis TaxID=152371 RepID=A0AAP0JI53_9MAGN